MIRVILPYHLRTPAHVDTEVKLDVEGPVTQDSVLSVLETCYPMLRGIIRDHVTQRRRLFLRFFACEQDLSQELPDAHCPKRSQWEQNHFSSSEPLLADRGWLYLDRTQQKEDTTR